MVEFSYNYGQIDAAAAGIKASSQAIVNEMGELNGVFNQIQWTGANQEAYVRTQKELEAGVDSLNALLGKLSQLVTAARESVAAMEQRQAGVWG